MVRKDADLLPRLGGKRPWFVEHPSVLFAELVHHPPLRLDRPKRRPVNTVEVVHLWHRGRVSRNPRETQHEHASEDQETSPAAAPRRLQHMHTVQGEHEMSSDLERGGA